MKKIRSSNDEYATARARRIPLCVCALLLRYRSCSCLESRFVVCVTNLFGQINKKNISRGHDACVCGHAPTLKRTTSNSNHNPLSVPSFCLRSLSYPFLGSPIKKMQMGTCKLVFWTKGWRNMTPFNFKEEQVWTGAMARSFFFFFRRTSLKNLPFFLSLTRSLPFWCPFLIIIFLLVWSQLCYPVFVFFCPTTPSFIRFGNRNANRVFLPTVTDQLDSRFDYAGKESKKIKRSS
ncbi:hypothetical protein BKA57DRAFT_204365 [Linnemannia elongata]|nr:hypothetical protein BKA57DRAFT_204365 [Linnemannia elongata]